MALSFSVATGAFPLHRSRIAHAIALAQGRLCDLRVCVCSRNTGRRIAGSRRATSHWGGAIAQQVLAVASQ